jgi:hypothetical protein
MRKYEHQAIERLTNHAQLFRASSAAQDASGSIQANNYTLDGITKALTWVVNAKTPICSWMVFAAEILLDLRAITDGHFAQADRQASTIAKEAIERIRFIHKTSEAVHVNQKTSLYQLQSSCQWAEDWPIPGHRYVEIRCLQPRDGKSHPLEGFQRVVWYSMSDKDKENAMSAIQKHEEIIQKPIPNPPGNPLLWDWYLKEFIPPAIDSRFLRHANPLMCGPLALEIKILYEQFGLGFANSYPSISAAAQLYNALRQIGRFDWTWPEMDVLIERHIKDIFLSGLPDDPQKIYDRAWIIAGASPAFIAEEKRIQKSGHQPKFLNKSRTTQERSSWDLLPSTLSQTLQDTFNGKDTFSNTVERLKKLLPRNSPQGQASKHAPAERPISGVAFLRELGDYLEILSASFDIDYVTLTRTCNALLKDITTEIDKMYQKKPHPEFQYQVPDFSSYATVLNILAEIKLADSERQAAGNSQPSPTIEMPETDVATRILSDYVKAGAKGVPGERQDEQLGLIPFDKGSMPVRKKEKGKALADTGARIEWDREEEAEAHRIAEETKLMAMAERRRQGEDEQGEGSEEQPPEQQASPSS